MDVLGKEEQVPMKVFRKGVGSVNNQTDSVLTTAVYHLRHLHASCQMDAMHQVYFLPIRTGRIVIGAASLFKYLYGPAAFRCSSKYQNHLVVIIAMQSVVS